MAEDNVQVKAVTSTSVEIELTFDCPEELFGMSKFTYRYEARYEINSDLWEYKEKYITSWQSGFSDLDGLIEHIKEEADERHILVIERKKKYKDAEEQINKAVDKYTHVPA